MVSGELTELTAGGHGEGGASPAEPSALRDFWGRI